jgi:K+-transporting ATPase ATPase C chain
MWPHLRANLWLLGLTLLFCSVLYPAVLWLIGQGLFRHQAQGSLIDEQGQPTRDEKTAIGSHLIAQPFTGDEYFHPRPSSVGYTGQASGASNYAASNPDLRQRILASLGPIIKDNDGRPVPADLVMTSGSGLDPHITLKGALYQLDRVADAWTRKTGRNRDNVKADIEDLLRNKVGSPLGGLAGVEMVNVLETNLALKRLMDGPSKP